MKRGSWIAVVAVFSGLVLAPGPGFTAGEEESLARVLQDLDHEFDRGTLPPTVRFTAENGTTRSAVRCATRPVADLERRFIDSAVSAHVDRVGTGHRAAKTTIPVVFHVLRKKLGGWNVSDERIQSQIEVLNEAFTPHRFEFVLQEVRRHNNNRFAKACLNGAVERRFKKRFAVDPSRTLNAYSCRPKQGVLGYAYFPSDYRESSFMHGIVLLHSSLPGGSAEPFDLGDTAVHEVGHYLGLFHTFEGGCANRGDRIADTPSEQSPASGCPLNRDTCPSAGTDPVTNFMDYSDDACIEEFTNRQAARMKDQVATFKPSL